MASGGHKPKSSASEPRQRSWQRTTSMSDKEDNLSIHSIPNDLRPNNWDFSDWRPSAPIDQTKRRKKGNPEWEREQSLTQDSPPPSERQHGTPRTFPRTKITPSTPTSQRVALENLRQHMTFSDQEDAVSNDGERNNDRNVLMRRANIPSRARHEGAADSQIPRPMPNSREDRSNRNNNKTEVNIQDSKPDSSHIVGRLMQIRDYIKQATSMMDSLNQSGDPPGYKDETERLKKLLDHLKEQETSYTQLLQSILSVRDESNLANRTNGIGRELGPENISRELTPNLESVDDTQSLDLDVQSEASEIERVLNLVPEVDYLKPRAWTYAYQPQGVSNDRSPSASSRPRIEDKLGLTSDNEDEEEETAAQSESSNESSKMDDTVISGRKHPDWDFELGEDELAAGGVLNPKEAAEQLVALKQQQELLTKLVEQQEQMRALKGRQAALLSLQHDAESRLATARQKSNEAQALSSALDEVASTMGNRAEALAAADDRAGRQPDSELSDIRQQLQYLRNELKTQDERPRNPPAPVQPVPVQVPAEIRAQAAATAAATGVSREQLESHLQGLLDKKDKLDEFLEMELSPSLTPATQEMSREQLQSKLVDLQTKKKRMDDMLKELQSMRADPLAIRNMIEQENAPELQSPAVQGVESEGEAALTRAEGSENMANGVLDLLGARQKLQKLNEVRGRLKQLKSLVHYYEVAEPGSPQAVDMDEDQSSIPAYSDYDGEPEVTRDRGPDPRLVEREVKPVQESKPKGPPPPRPPPPVQQSDENNSSSESSSESESQLSSLGPWGDDPEIQEKVKKLKAAKEKLRRLQSLVAMVQDSPDTAGELPDNIAELAASIEDVESQFTQTDDRNNASVSEGEVPMQQAERDAFYQSKLQEQLDELNTLKDEKLRLLNIQEQLQSLQSRFQQADRQAVEDGRQESKPKKESSERSRETPQTDSTAAQQSTGPSVTFSSNEEVYDKMRKQRMLREELRDKKKQLESIMKKDRNKRQYIKNQDNQSDTVSYTTDAFGASASADATMATWGGSTVDNMESITEDGAADQQDNEDEEDDAYPSDGILQVEEEEEENQSDNETYTIEEDVRQRRKARAMAKPSAEPNMRQAKTKRTFPRPSRQVQGQGARPKEGTDWRNQPSFSQWTRTSRSKSKQENYRSAEEIIQEDEQDGSKGPGSPVEVLQKQLEQTAMLCQSLLQDQQPGTGHVTRLGSTGYGAVRDPSLDLQQQLQQQQLMMSLNQCYQQMSMQQLEMQNMQRQMQGLALQVSEHSEINESGMSSDLRFRSQQSLLSPMMRPSPHMTGYDAFRFSPRFPTNLSYQPDLSQQRMSESPMRSSAPDIVFDLENQFSSQSKAGDTSLDRQQRPGPAGKYSKAPRQQRSEAYPAKGKTKSLSPPMLNNFQSPASQQRLGSTQGGFRMENTAEESPYQTSETVPQLNIEALARRRREFLQRNLPKVIAKSTMTSDTGQDRVGGCGPLEEEDQVFRPGLSAGISGAGFLEDGSVVSSVHSSVAAMARAINDQASQEREARDSDDPNELSLFETLRETIYSEVATLISQNENRPHYLIELFRELQRLNTDYLRQRVLYDVKDVVAKYLVDENADSVAAPPPPWMNPAMAHYTASELTPSESIVTSDDEEIKAKLKEKVSEKRKGATHLLRSGSLKNDEFDYQEQAEVDSSVSTPSNSYWESPFAQDSLGETVIHLDKTLQRMREYEKKQAERAARGGSGEGRGAMSTTEACSSSAMDQGSESSVTSDVPYPRIDTQQLDLQIKSIMTEVIPVIKEHMDNVCSPQLLAYIKRLVLSLTRQYDSGQEFARFFHRQLGTILQDALAKFEGRKMRECGEEVLVDMSEALFNELAFFRLMQDLDDPVIAEKMQQAKVVFDSDSEEDDRDQTSEESDTTETSTANASDNEDETKVTQTEEEDLGKARDDAFAIEVEIKDADDKDQDPESLYKNVQIELAVSETKPYTRIGSDEDDEDADESQSNEDPSETAVSLNAKRLDNADELEEEPALEKSDGSWEAFTAQEAASTGPATLAPGAAGDQADADQGASNGKPEQKPADNNNGDLLNGDIEVITMDDLPASMTVMSQEELQTKLVQEEQDVSGAEALLAAMDTQPELAGDAQFLKEPDEASG